MSYKIAEVKIDPFACVGCKACSEVCPTAAIEHFVGGVAVWDGTICVSCGACDDVCEGGALVVDWI